MLNKIFATDYFAAKNLFNTYINIFVCTVKKYSIDILLKCKT